jgi:arylsulfatase A-like enzyme
MLKPHLIFALIDDWGWYDVGFRGNDLIKTPVIDNLVTKEAALLERHYTYKF